MSKKRKSKGKAAERPAWPPRGFWSWCRELRRLINAECERVWYKRREEPVVGLPSTVDHWSWYPEPDDAERLTRAYIKSREIPSEYVGDLLYYARPFCRSSRPKSRII